MPQQANPFIAPVCHDNIKIVYQDDSLLLINKPSGLLSLSGKHPLNKDSVHFRLIQDFPSATMIHRLDFGTSGIMLIALNKQVNAALCRQFKERTVHKTYTAHLFGHLANNEGQIYYPIAKDPPNFPLLKICEYTGKAALTHYRVLKRLHTPAVTQVEFTPLTGRTHQLRIHSQAIGHPILGCDLYAHDTAFSLAQRLMLHASSLEFDHPVSGERIHGICPSPF